MQRSILLSSRAFALGLALLLAACGGSADGGGGSAGSGGTGGTGGTGGSGGTGGDGGTGGSGGEEPLPCTQPIIDRLEPAEGFVGTQVKIFGRCFSDLAAKNKVAFNNVTSSVLGASADGTQLSTSVPSGAVTGPISVSTDYGQGFVRTDGPEFTVTTDAPPPAINSISPSAVTAGAGDTQVTINGSGFVFRSKAQVDGEPVDTIQTSPTSLKVTIPAAALATARSVAISVYNSPPGGGTSGVVNLEVVPSLNVVSATAIAVNKVVVFFDRNVSFSSIRDKDDWHVAYGATSLTVYKVERVGQANNRALLTTGSQVPNRSYTVSAPGGATSQQGGALGTRTATFRAWRSDPELLGTFGGTAGCDAGTLQKPSGIGTAGGMLYVTEEDGQQVQLITATDGTFAGFLGNDGTGPGLHDGDAVAVGCPDTGSNAAESFAFPRGGVVVDGTGARWIADTGNDRVFRFDADGSFLETVTRGLTWQSPVVLGVAGNYVWVANGDNRIYPVPASGLNGNPLFGAGINAGQFDFDLAGGGTPGFASYFQERFVADPGNHRVQKFLDESPQGWIGKGRTSFGSPADCLVDTAGEGSSDCAGTADGEFTNPSGLAMDQSGNLWVIDDADADGDGHPGRVQKFSRDGTFLHSFNLDYLPGGIAVDGEGFLWIADQTNDSVHKYGI